MVEDDWTKHHIWHGQGPPSWGGSDWAEIWIKLKEVAIRRHGESPSQHIHTTSGKKKKTTTSKSIFLAQEAKRDRLREGIRAARSTLGMWTLVDLSSDYIWDLRGDQILNEQRNKWEKWHLKTKGKQNKIWH